MNTIVKVNFGLICSYVAAFITRYLNLPTTAFSTKLSVIAVMYAFAVSLFLVLWKKKKCSGVKNV